MALNKPNLGTGPDDGTGSTARAVGQMIIDIIEQMWDTVTGGIAYLAGNVGINTATPNAVLDVQGDTIIKPTDGTQSYKFTDLISGTTIVLEGQTTATGVSFALRTLDADGTDNVNIQIIGLSDVTFANRERLLFGWDTASSFYFLQSEAAGSGVLRPIHLYTEGNDNQLVMATDGSVGVDKAAPNSKFAVSGLPVYANNAAALVGGLTEGDFYKTASTGDATVMVTNAT